MVISLARECILHNANFLVSHAADTILFVRWMGDTVVAMSDTRLTEFQSYYGLSRLLTWRIITVAAYGRLVHLSDLEMRSDSCETVKSLTCVGCIYLGDGRLYHWTKLVENMCQPPRPQITVIAQLNFSDYTLRVKKSSVRNGLCTAENRLALEINGSARTSGRDRRAHGLGDKGEMAASMYD